MNSWRSRRLVIGLSLTFFTACLTVGISEYSYKSNSKLLSEVMSSYNTRKSVSSLIVEMLNAESGVRGFLLSGDESYLDPYKKAVNNISKSLVNIQLQLEASDGGVHLFVPFSQRINHKLWQMEQELLLVRMGQAQVVDMNTLMGLDHQAMNDIHEFSEQVMEVSSNEARSYGDKIQTSLFFVRIGVATVTIVGILAFYLYLRQNISMHRLNRHKHAQQLQERSRLEQLVRERTASLTQLATHLQQVREDDRNHLARELHDELGALLTAAKLDVARLKPKIDMTNPEIKDRMKHLTEMLNSGIALKRKIVEDLRPSSLSNLGLSTSLEILTSEFAKAMGVEVVASFDSVELSDTTELTIYRLVQEALTNIGKYAKASQIQVSVTKDSMYVNVRIQDNGKGFDLAKIRTNSHGLAGMRHRVEAAGGQLSIHTVLGGGTTISALIPLNTNAVKTVAFT